MKKAKSIVIIIILILTFNVNAQIDNYSKEIIYKIPTTTSVNNPSTSQASVTISYQDGFGRNVQIKNVKQSTSELNVIQHIEYDALGREEKEFLPYVSSNQSLLFDPNANNDVLDFYANPNITLTGNPNFESTNFPYSQKIYDDRYVYRIIAESSPGDVWSISNNHTYKYENLFNETNEVKKLTAIATWNSSLERYDEAFNNLGYYQPNELRKLIIKNENWSVNNDESKIIKYLDKDGKLILLKSFNGGQEHNTYYVYDQYGNISFVLPPLASDNINVANFNNLCFQYIYDYRNRLIEKKVPNKTWEFYVYDKNDRLIATGPHKSPFISNSNMGWSINKYDAFDRIIYTGWYTGTASDNQGRKIMQNLCNNQTNFNETRSNTNVDNVNISYTNLIFPTTNFKLLTVNYYDDYNFVNSPTIVSNIEGQPTNLNVKGLLTGTWVRILNDNASLSNESTYLLYDNKYRMIRKFKQNYLGGYSIVDNKLDFIGKIEYSKTYHKRNNSSNELRIVNTFTYDNNENLIKHIHQVDSEPEQLISFKSYDELGNLISENVGGNDTSGSSGLQKVDYTFNVKGQLKSINDVNDIQSEHDLFAFNIRYDNPDNSIPQYNGNISEVFWKTANDDVLRKYEFSYDNLNRLTLANYNRPNDQNINAYKEEIEYDKNGNIQKLKRNGDVEYDIYNGELEIDNLTYYYEQNSNKLLKVLDSSNIPSGFEDDSNGITDNQDDYNYDSLGNLIYDQNKKIHLIVYNNFNLPVEISFDDGNKIIFLYNALGEKVNKKVQNIVTQQYTSSDYLDDFHYVDGRLKFFPHANGFVKFEEYYGPQISLNGIRQNYVFNYTDHLGNVRVSYQFNLDTHQIEIVEENNYYPFGLKHNGYNLNGSTAPNKYKFQGQELQDEFGLNWYSFKWRNYDAAIGRFMSIDPLADKYNWMTPYQFSSNQCVHAPELEGLESQGDLNCDDMQSGSFVMCDEDVGNVKVDFEYESIVYVIIPETIDADDRFDGSSEWGNYDFDATTDDYETDEIIATVAETAIDFTPILGGVKDIYQGIESGNGWQIGLGAATIVLDVFSFGSATLTVGSVKTAVKIGAKELAEKGVKELGVKAAKEGGNVLSKAELLRIKNAATRINRPITVVGSRASGKAGAYSDWDYVIEGLNSKSWSKIKNSLPGSRSILDNTPRNIDIFKGPVNPDLPHITINPR